LVWWIVQVFLVCLFPSCLYFWEIETRSENGTKTINLPARDSSALFLGLWWYYSFTTCTKMDWLALITSVIVPSLSISLSNWKFLGRNLYFTCAYKFYEFQLRSWDLSRDKKGVFSKPTFTKAALRPATVSYFGDKNITYLKVAFFFLCNSISFPSLIRQNLQNQN
jgi:hypothetical protein